MKTIIIAVLLCLSFGVAAKPPTKSQCENYATSVMAMAANRDEGVPFMSLIDEINSIDMVQAGMTDNYDNVLLVRWLYTKDAIQVYREDRLLTPENIRTNRYNSCMGAK